MPAIALQDKKSRLAIQLARCLDSRLSQVARPSRQFTLLWKNPTHCHSYSRLDLIGGSRLACRQKLHTCQACQKLKHHANWSTTRQKVQTDHSVFSWLELITQSSRESKPPASSILKNLTFHIPFSSQYKYPIYPRNVENF